jgi:hypothetical protein
MSLRYADEREYHQDAAVSVQWGGALLGVSKSDGQKLRVWICHTNKVSRMTTKSSMKRQQRPIVHPFQDVHHTESTWAWPVDFVSVGVVYNQMSIVSLDGKICSLSTITPSWLCPQAPVVMEPVAVVVIPEW